VAEVDAAGWLSEHFLAIETGTTTFVHGPTALQPHAVGWIDPVRPTNRTV